MELFFEGGSSGNTLCWSPTCHIIQGQLETNCTDVACRHVDMSFPDGSVGKEFACNAGDLGSIPGLGRSSGEGKDYPLQYSDLENSMDCIVHGITESGSTQQLPLSLFHV